MTAGFSIPVHNSLTTPLLLAGAPREFSIMNGIICAAVGLGMHSWLIVPICLIFQVVAIALTKKDPQFFQVMSRHIKQKSYYGV